MIFATGVAEAVGVAGGFLSASTGALVVDRVARNTPTAISTTASTPATAPRVALRCRRRAATAARRAACRSTRIRASSRSRLLLATLVLHTSVMSSGV